MNETLWPGGVRRTRARQMIYELLERAPEPLDAAELYKRLCLLEQKPASLSSVYRTLELFCAHGMVGEAVRMDGSVCYELLRHEHRHYAVCKSCSKLVPLLDACPLEQLHPQLAEQGFTVTEHQIQLYGYCAGCMKKRREQ